MKKIILVFSFIVLFASCSKKESVFIEFSENQPLDVEEVAEISDNFFGNYISADSSFISIRKDKIIHHWFSDEMISTKEKDSLSYLTFDKNYVIDNTTKQKVKLIQKNDSLFWKMKHADTTCVDDFVLKIFKDAIVLNSESDGKIYVNIYKKENNQIRQFYLGSEEDFKMLQKEIKIEHTFSYNENDTTVTLKPTRADFRKLLRKKGYTFETIYSKL